MSYIIFPCHLVSRCNNTQRGFRKVRVLLFLLSNAFEEVSLCVSFFQTFDVEVMFSWFDFCVWKLN